MITVAILGGGFMGAAHAANYKALEGRVRVKTVASRQSERAAAVADSVGAELTGDVDAALHDPEVDLVDICLPTGLHRETAEAALAAGKHVFLEKPIALTLADADAIVAAAARAEGFFMVGLVRTSSPNWGTKSRTRSMSHSSGSIASTAEVSPTFACSPAAPDRYSCASSGRSPCQYGNG